MKSDLNRLLGSESVQDFFVDVAYTTFTKKQLNSIENEHVFDFFTNLESKYKSKRFHNITSHVSLRNFTFSYSQLFCRFCEVSSYFRTITYDTFHVDFFRNSEPFEYIVSLFFSIIIFRYPTHFTKIIGNTFGKPFSFESAE